MQAREQEIRDAKMEGRLERLASKIPLLSILDGLKQFWLLRIYLPIGTLQGFSRYLRVPFFFFLKQGFMQPRLAFNLLCD